MRVEKLKEEDVGGKMMEICVLVRWRRVVWNDFMERIYWDYNLIGNPLEGSVDCKRRCGGEGI